MQQIITAKLKLIATPEQHRLLRQTQLAYRDALNHVSQYAFTSGKISNVQRLHKGTYRDVRSRCGLPSQMACSVMRQVSATYKGLWTKVRRNAAHRNAGYTKKRYKGLDKPPKYVSPTLIYVHGYDYGFKADNYASIMTLHGRITIPYQGYHRHISLIRQGARFGEAKLWYDKAHKQFYLLVSLELDIPQPTPESLANIAGVDVGARYLATTATIDNHSHFHPGKRVRTRADHYARLKKRLQKKGTRSATRRLIAVNGRERRLKLQVNHSIAKTIVDTHPHTLIGLENLAGIRERTKRHRKRRKKNGKGVEPVSPRARRANRHASKWAFAELQKLLALKAVLSGSLTIKVDADYTSQTCPMCGHIDKRNRPKKGLLFCCRNKECSYRQRTGRAYILHADLVGARNIAMRTLLTRQDWVRTGRLSTAPGSELGPNASGVELKAAKLSRMERYAELRWES